MAQNGHTENQTKRALDAYRRDIVNLSRASEIAKLSLRDILLRLSEESIELNYDLRELQRNSEDI
jgi:predicted HTH domain antitoxin